MRHMELIVPVWKQKWRETNTAVVWPACLWASDTAQCCCHLGFRSHKCRWKLWRLWILKFSSYLTFLTTNSINKVHHLSHFYGGQFSGIKCIYSCVSIVTVYLQNLSQATHGNLTHQTVTFPYPAKGAETGAQDFICPVFLLPYHNSASLLFWMFKIPPKGLLWWWLLATKINYLNELRPYPWCILRLN